MRRFFLLWLFCLLGLWTLHANIHVLSICIAEYPTESGWNTLSANNDRTLVSQLFPNAKTLDNKEATFAAIKQSLSNLVRETVKGDTVIVHFSGHGQQILTETSTSEPDKVDEALVSYDAAKRKSSSYWGQAHFTDDLFGDYISKIRNKAAETGLVIAVIDACHSASMDKNTDSSEATYRGTDEIFGVQTLSSDSLSALRESYNTPDKSTLAIGSHIANVIFISACSTNQRNYEIKVNGKNYGSLTYYFCEAYKENGLNNLSEFLTTLYKEMSSNPTMHFYGQTPDIRNTIGWTAPTIPTHTPIQPANPDNLTGQTGNSLYQIILPIIAALLVFLVIWIRKKK